MVIETKTVRFNSYRNKDCASQWLEKQKNMKHITKICCNSQNFNLLFRGKE